MSSKQLKLSALLSYIAMAMHFIYSLFLMPLMTRRLGQSEYGLYAVCLSVLNYLALTEAGLSSAYNSYYFRAVAAGDKLGEKQLNGALILVSAAFGGLGCIVGLFLSSRPTMLLGTRLTAAEIELAKNLLRITSLASLAQMLCAAFAVIIQAQEKFILNRSLEALRYFLLAILNVTLLLIGFRSPALLGSVLTVLCLMLAANLIYVLKYLRMPITFVRLPSRLFKNMLSFAAFIFLQTIISLFDKELDKILVIRYIGSEAAGVYSISVLLSTNVLSNIVSATGFLFIPIVNRIVAENKPDMDKVLTDLLISVGRIQFFLQMLLFSGLVIFGRPFIHFFVGEAYSGSYLIMLLLAFPLVLGSPLGIIGQTVVRAKHLHRQLIMIFLLLTLAFLIIRIPLVKQLGLYGAAAGTCASMLALRVIVPIVFFSKAAKLDMLKWAKSLLSVMPSFALPFLAGLAILKFVYINSLPKMIMLIIAYTAVFCICIWLWGMNNSERNIFLKPLAKITKKYRNDD